VPNYDGAASGSDGESGRTSDSGSATSNEFDEDIRHDSTRFDESRLIPAKQRPRILVPAETPSMGIVEVVSILPSDIEILGSSWKCLENRGGSNIFCVALADGVNRQGKMHLKVAESKDGNGLYKRHCSLTRPDNFTKLCVLLPNVEKRQELVLKSVVAPYCGKPCGEGSAYAMIRAGAQKGELEAIFSVEGLWTLSFESKSNSNITYAVSFWAHSLAKNSIKEQVKPRMAQDSAMSSLNNGQSGLETGQKSKKRGRQLGFDSLQNQESPKSPKFQEDDDVPALQTINPFVYDVEVPLAYKPCCCSLLVQPHQTHQAVTVDKRFVRGLREMSPMLLQFQFPDQRSPLLFPTPIDHDSGHIKIVARPVFGNPDGPPPVEICWDHTPVRYHPHFAPLCVSSFGLSASMPSPNEFSQKISASSTSAALELYAKHHCSFDCDISVNVWMRRRSLLRELVQVEGKFVLWLSAAGRKGLEHINKSEADSTTFTRLKHFTASAFASKRPLIQFASTGCQSIVRALVRCGRYDLFPIYRGTTPLHIAAAFGSPEVVSELLLHPSAVAALVTTDDLGFTPKHIAIIGLRLDIVALFDEFATQEIVSASAEQPAVRETFKDDSKEPLEQYGASSSFDSERTAEESIAAVPHDANVIGKRLGQLLAKISVPENTPAPSTHSWVFMDSAGSDAPVFAGSGREVPPLSAVGRHCSLSLPTIEGSNPNIPTITCETVRQNPHPLFSPHGHDFGLTHLCGLQLCRLIDGHYNDVINRFFIVDCRFDYEFEGGHIKSAINLHDNSEIASYFLSRAVDMQDSQRTVIVFYCEFSFVRGPAAYACKVVFCRTPSILI
jgi:hypothetical protein